MKLLIDFVFLGCRYFLMFCAVGCIAKYLDLAWYFVLLVVLGGMSYMEESTKEGRDGDNSFPGGKP